MKKLIAGLCALGLFAVIVQAQMQKLQNNEADSDRVIVRPNPEPRPMPVPMIIVSPDRKPITLQDLKIDVEVIGNLAMTTYDMTFHNPNQMIMEGEFVFPLTENQNVSALALDINGKLRDGVVVEKQKARQTFESIVRRGIDPALVEKTAGNQFKTRIYPFNPNGTRRIKVTIEEPLVTKDKGYVYKLPLKFNQIVNFAINVEMPVYAVFGRMKFNEEVPFKFDKTETVLKGSFAKKDWHLDNTVMFFIPIQKNEQIFTHKEGNETYFYSDINIAAASKEKTLPKKIALVWDTSLSSSKRDVLREISLLNEYFKMLSDVEVTFVTFNIDKDISKNFKVKKGDWSSLQAEIDSLIYDGATRFDKLSLNDLKVDEILVFSDGVSTFGNTNFDKADVPVFVVNSSAEFNRGGLINAARQSNGSFVNLNAVSDKEALTLLTKQNLRLISVSFDKNKFKEVFPQVGAEVSENLTFAGIMTASSGEITLSFGFDKKNITQTKTIKIKSAGENPAVARLWAVQKIKEFELESEKNEKEILKLGQEFSIVTDFTSLLVLENVSDYATYKITPPQELRSEYDRLIANVQKGEENKEKSALDNAISQAAEIKEWWKKNFEQSKPSKVYEKLKSVVSGNARQEESSVMMDSVAVEESASLNKSMTAIPAAAMLREERQSERRRSQKQSEASGIAADMEMDSANGFMKNEESRDGDESGKFKDSKPSASIQVKAWDPQTPYMKILKKSKDGELYQDYLKLKNGYDDQPSFFFDVTDEFTRRKQNDTAVIVLSNVVEMKLDNPELLRTAANKLMELGYYQYAVDVFEKIVKLRGEDPQSYRDLALAYQANKEYQKSLDTFYKIMLGSWDRFNSIKQIVFVEMNNLIALSPKLDMSKINKELVFEMPVDVRIVLGWSTDNTDIDLHINDPYGNHTFYSDRFSRIGARLSVDLTQGFGPEEFMLKKAVNGDYEIFTNNFGDRRQSISGPTVLYLDIYTFYGTKNQTHQRALVRTENVKENNVIGSVNFKNK